MTPRRRRLPVIALATALLLAYTAQAKDLAEAIPQDAVVVLRAIGLHAAWQRFAASQAWKKLQDSQVEDVRNGIAEVKAGIREFETRTGVGFEQGVGAMFGADAALVLFADGTAACVARSSDPAMLRTAVETLVTLEGQDGRIAAESHSYHEGVRIWSTRRQLGGGHGAQTADRHHALVQDYLIVSEDLARVRRVIDVIERGRAALAASPEYVEAQRFVRDDALVRVYVDTDRIVLMDAFNEFFDGNMRSPVARMLVRKTKEMLPATRYLVGTLAFGDGNLTGRYVLTYDDGALPPQLKAMLPRRGAAMDITHFTPEQAVFCWAHQLNKRALWRYWIETVREQRPDMADTMERRADQIGPALAGMPFEDGLLAQIGDQAALYVMLGPPQGPPAVAVAVELRSPHQIPTAMRTLVGTAVMAEQMDAEKTGRETRLALSHERHANTEVTTLLLKTHPFDGTVNPTLFVRDRFIVFTSTPASARQMLDAYAAAENALEPQTTPRTQSTLYSEAMIHGVYLQRLIRKHRGFLIAQGLKEGKGRHEVEKELAALEFLLGFLKRIEIKGTFEPGIIDRSLFVQF